MDIKKFIGIRLLVSAFLCTVLMWGASVKTIADHHTFLQESSFIVLAVTILAGVISIFLIPEKLVELIADLFRKLSKSLWVLIPFLVTSVGFLYWVNQDILHSFLGSADEHSCYFLAECLRRGRLWVEPHELSAFFDVVHVGNRDGKWFSVYPVGWPLIWAFGLKWNIVDWLNPVMVSLSLFFFYIAGRRIYGATVSFLAIVIVALAPFFIFTGASYFSHGTCLLMVSLFLWGYTGWQKELNEKKKIIWAIIIGLSVGYGLMTRYLTMASIAGPFLLYEIYPIILRKKKLEKGHWIAGCIILCFMACILWQNYSVTGKPFRAPNKHDKSWERLGFRDFYTPIDALFYLIARFFFLAEWFPPYFIVVYFGTFFVKTKMTPMKRLMQFGFLYPAFAYFFYFSWGGNQMGPRYYYSGLPFLAFAVADKLRTLWNEGEKFPRQYLLGVMIVALLSNGYFFYKQGSYYDEASRERKALYVLAEKQLKEPSIVFIRGFLGKKLVMAPDDAIRNSPFLDTPILYAMDKGEAENKKLMKYYPNRKYFRGSYHRESNKPVLEQIG